MKKFQPKKFYDLPKKAFFWVYIAATILSLGSIATLWVGIFKALPELAMTFNAFVVSITLALTLMSSFNSEKKIRISACLYCNFMIILVVGWILLLINNEKVALSGTIIATIMFVSIAALSIFLLVIKNKAKGKPQPAFIPPGQQKVEEPKVEPKVEEKKEEVKPIEQPKVEEQKAIVPLEVQPQKEEEKIDIIHINLE